MTSMMALDKWGLDRRHLLLLFIAGMASRGMIKSLLGTNASLALLLVVALYYVYTKRESESLYDEAARLQVQAAAKLDAIHGLSNDDGTPLSNVERLAMRQTHFQLNETDRMIITDRLHQYSNKMGGSHKDRRKFLAASRRRRTEAEAEALSNGQTIKEPSASELLRQREAIDRETSKIVEEAVDATM